MKTIRAELVIKAPIERVFDRISDHGSYHQLPGISSARLLKEGVKERNGLGAIRELKSSGLRFEEEVVAFHRPSSFEYKIRASTIPIRHEIGRLKFEEVEEGTRVVWTSTFTMGLPLMSVLNPVVALRLGSAFRGFLSSFQAQLER